jgi:hypothetical protein
MNKIDIQLTPQEMDYIANCLAQRPWAEVNALLANLKGQIDYQQKVEAEERVGMTQPNGYDNVSPIQPTQ